MTLLYSCPFVSLALSLCKCLPLQSTYLSVRLLISCDVSVSCASLSFPDSPYTSSRMFSFQADRRIDRLTSRPTHGQTGISREGQWAGKERKGWRDKEKQEAEEEGDGQSKGSREGRIRRRKHYKRGRERGKERYTLRRTEKEPAIGDIGPYMCTVGL